jgi:nitroreductase
MIMSIRELVLKNRSTRRFHQDFVIDRQTLVDFVDLARHSASGSNVQPLKFYLSCDTETNAIIFPRTRWAGAIEDWDGPGEGEKPSAYIIILGDKEISETFGVDHGIAAQSIMLGAVERGLGGCMIGSVLRVKLHRELSLPDHYHILLVLALGKPNETIVIEPLEPGGDIKYWHDKKGVHHVPKRSLKELIVE